MGKGFFTKPQRRGSPNGTLGSPNGTLLNATNLSRNSLAGHLFMVFLPGLGHAWVLLRAALLHSRFETAGARRVDHEDRCGSLPLLGVRKGTLLLGVRKGTLLLLSDDWVI